MKTALPLLTLIRRVSIQTRSCRTFSTLPGAHNVPPSLAPTQVTIEGPKNHTHLHFAPKNTDAPKNPTPLPPTVKDALDAPVFGPRATEVPYSPANAWNSTIIKELGFIVSNVPSFEVFLGKAPDLPEKFEPYCKESYNRVWLEKEGYDEDLANCAREVVYFFRRLKEATIIDRGNEGATDLVAIRLLELAGLDESPFHLRSKHTYDFVFAGRRSWCKPDFVVDNLRTKSSLIVQEDKSATNTSDDPLSQAVAGAYAIMRAYDLDHPKQKEIYQFHLITLSGEFIQFAQLDLPTNHKTFFENGIRPKLDKQIEIKLSPRYSLLVPTERKTILQGLYGENLPKVEEMKVE